jgi:hypothetical protein
MSFGFRGLSLIAVVVLTEVKQKITILMETISSGKK